MGGKRWVIRANTAAAAAAAGTSKTKSIVAPTTEQKRNSNRDAKDTRRLLALLVSFNGCLQAKRSLNVDRIGYIKTHKDKWLLSLCVSVSFTLLWNSSSHRYWNAIGKLCWILTSRFEIGAFSHSSFGFVDSRSSSGRRLNCFDKQPSVYAFSAQMRSRNHRIIIHRDKHCAISNTGTL